MLDKNTTPNQPVWHHLAVPEIFRILGTGERGLAIEEALLRLERDGLNSLPASRPPSLLKLLLRQFSSVLILILLVASAVTFLLGEHIDAGVILAAVIINVVVGFFQERKAEQALAELKKIVSYQAHVIRKGEQHTIPVEQVVVGDIIELKAGDRIPADARLTQVYNLETNEAPLTGESLPITKTNKVLKPGIAVADRLNMVYLGTSAVTGSGRAVVTATGLKTEIGGIAKLLAETKRDTTPLQQRLSRLGKTISIVVLGICLFIFLAGTALGFGVGKMFATAVAVAVSAIPEGMVVGVTAILAIGMRRILKRRALVRELLAAETLGSTTVICTDKTGTLTTGQMQVAVIATSDQKTSHPIEQLQNHSTSLILLRVGVLASDAYIENPDDELQKWQVIGNPTERALVLAGVQAGIPISNLRHDFKRLDAIPFDSNTKYMVTLHQDTKGGHWLYMKGAPEVVLDYSSKYSSGKTEHRIDDKYRRKILQQEKQFSQQGLRLLAFALRRVDKSVKKITDLKVASHAGDPSKKYQQTFSPLTFLGLVGIKDPLRQGVTNTIMQARKAGIKVVMITGDHHLTAQAIAQELNLPAAEENIIEGKDLAKMDDNVLRKKITQVSVFARTTPHDKPRIIDAWQAQGEVVAMTGDGVNDAPALKSANIGVALGSGSDVAKEVADIVLLDNNFKTIVATVEEGRVIFQNIRKMVLYLLSDSLSEVVLILGAFLIGAAILGDLPLPILATQILWINLVTDSFPALAFTIDPASHEVMEDKPIRLTEPVIDKKRKILIGMMSVTRGLAALLLFWWLWQLGDNLEHARTVIFTAMVLSSLLYAISCKQLKFPFFSGRSWNNHYLTGALLIAFLLQLSVIYLPWLQDVFNTAPLYVADWLLVVSFAGLLIVAVETLKRYLWKGKPSKVYN